MRLESAPGVEDVRLLAKKRLPRLAFDFIDGGAEGEVTLRANRRAFDGLTFRPRYLQDVTRRDQETSVVGTRLSLPVMLAQFVCATLPGAGIFNHFNLLVLSCGGPPHIS